jgi:predicted nucleotidyltransferase
MLDSETRKALSDFQSILESWNDLPLLVGAAARMIIFDRKFGEGRKTTDLDFGVVVKSWEDFQELRSILVGGMPPKFKEAKNPLRVIHIETSIEIDIVPFGDIGSPNQSIKWPNSKESINVLGFEDAYLNSKAETVDDLEVQVIDTPAFIALKMIAWRDRRDRTSKDLADIRFVLERYQYENEDSLYEEVADKLVSGDIEFGDIAIYFLGKEIKRIFSQDALSVIMKAVEEILIAQEEYEEQDVGAQNNFIRRMKTINDAINS